MLRPDGPISDARRRAMCARVGSRARRRGRFTLVNPSGAPLLASQPDPEVSTAEGPVWRCRDFTLPDKLSKNDLVQITNAGPFVRRAHEDQGAGVVRRR